MIIDQPNREALLRNFAAEIESGRVISRQRWDKHTERIISERTVDGTQVPAVGPVGAVRHNILLDADRLRNGTAVVE